MDDSLTGNRYGRAGCWPESICWGRVMHDVLLSPLNPGLGFACHRFPAQTLELRNTTHMLAVWSWGDPFFKTRTPCLFPPPTPFKGLNALGFPHGRSATQPQTIPLYKLSHVSVNERPLAEIAYLIKTGSNTLVEMKSELSDSFGLACHLQIDLPSTLGEKPAKLFVFRHGVLLEELEMPLGYPGAKVAVASSDLKTDATGFAVVQNQDYERLLDHIRVKVAELLNQSLRVAERQHRTGLDLELLRKLHLSLTRESK